MTKTLEGRTNAKHAAAPHSQTRAAALGRLGPKGASVIQREQRPAGETPFDGLLTNRILTALPGEDFARLLPHLEPVSLAQGTNLYSFDEPVHFAYFPETAVLSQLYVLEDGSSAEAAVVGREGLAGMSAIFGPRAPSYSTVVTVGGSALRLRAETMRQEFARAGAMQRLLLACAGERVTHISQRAVCNGRHTVERRMCSWLLMIQERAGEDLL
ncbi:MAG TPA: Crp/Fnr family transcriptional regulator, partial [Pyrinomonadaceae bacterium]|nr:Crp/Fnr family transcriptional regulator [Pyrinomonadaceae bacterium]